MRFFIFIIVLFLFSSCNWQSDTIAEVGKFKITKDDYKYFLVKRYGEKDSYKDVPKIEKNAILEQMIIRKLKTNLAYDRGMDKDEKLVADYENRKNQMVANLYFEKVLIDRLFSDEDIRKEFEMKKTEVKASHVLISFKTAENSMNDRSQEAALKLAKKVSKLAKEGKNTMSQLALLHSDDLNVRDNGGNLGYFSWGQMAEPFQEAAYSMKIGEISEPVLSPFGYHVIRVVDKRKNLRYNESKFEKEKEKIKRSLYRQHKDSAQVVWLRHMEKLKKDAHIVYEGKNVPALIEANIKRKATNDFNKKSFTEAEKNIELVRWDNGVFTFGDLIDAYGTQIGKYVSTLTDSSKLMKNAEKITSNKLVLEAAEKMGLDKDPKINTELKNFLEYTMIKTLETSELKDKVKFNDDDLRAYYEKNPSEFKVPEKIEIWEIFMSDKEQAEILATAIQKGQRDFIQSAKAVSEDKFYRRKGGYIGFRSLNGRSTVSQAAFAIGENKITGPVRYKRGWAIIKTGKIQPERLRTFGESKNQLVHKVRTNMLRELQEAWEKDMLATYKVEMNKEIIYEM
jgi:parvulin-like peptidyl-prolyl isomerase